MTNKTFTINEAWVIANKLGINFAEKNFTLDDFTKGMNVELEHGLRSSDTNVTNDDPVITGKIALAHLNEFGDYYRRLEQMEKQAETAQNH